MPLPKINTPTYELELPSTGKKIKYRPFLVREEKILLMALESEDMKQITDAVVSILSDCIQTRGVKVADLSTFDIEYLFLNIRSRSVGESVEVNITCPDDGETSVLTEIDLDSIKVEKVKGHTNTIKLDDTLSMRLKYPLHWSSLLIVTLKLVVSKVKLVNLLIWLKHVLILSTMQKNHGLQKTVQRKSWRSFSIN